MVFGIAFERTVTGGGHRVIAIDTSSRSIRPTSPISRETKISGSSQTLDYSLVEEESITFPFRFASHARSITLAAYPETFESGRARHPTTPRARKAKNDVPPALPLRNATVIRSSIRKREDYWGNVNPSGRARFTMKQALRRSDDDGHTTAITDGHQDRPHLQHLRPGCGFGTASGAGPSSAAFEPRRRSPSSHGSQTLSFFYVSDLIAEFSGLP